MVLASMGMTLTRCSVFQNGMRFVLDKLMTFNTLFTYVGHPFRLHAKQIPPVGVSTVSRGSPDHMATREQ